MPDNLLSFYTGKRILITGGSGYLGSSLISRLKQYPCKIVLINRNHSSTIANAGIAEIEELIDDIRRPDIWEEILESIDLIFYFAAQTSVYKANENPQEDFLINVLPIVNLLETCRKKNWNPTILFSGTVTVSGIPLSLPVSELNSDNPLSIYDLHKLIIENYLKYYANNGVIKSVTLRLANVYGPGINSKSADRGILNLMIRKAINGDDLTLYGDGNFLRDYIYIDDVVNAFILCAINIDVVNSKHLVVGSGIGHTIREAFEMVQKNVQQTTKKYVKILSVPPPENLSPVESRNFVADISFLSKIAGWTAKTKLSEGINTTIRYYNQ